MSKRTSRVFAAMRALYQRLDEQSYPVASNADRPQVVFGDYADDNTPRERIVVVGRVDESRSEWATFGNPSRDEEMLFLVRLEIEVPGQGGLDLLDRMEAISDVIQGVLRDTTTGQPVALGFDGEVKVASVVRVDPLFQAAAEGVIGRVDHYVSVTARL